VGSRQSPDRRRGNRRASRELPLPVLKNLAGPAEVLQIESLTRISPPAIICAVDGRSSAPAQNRNSVHEKSLNPSYRPVNPDGTFQINTDTFKQNVLGLTRNILTGVRIGDDAAVEAMAETLGVIRPPVQAILDKPKDAAVDIEPRDVTA
jgi:hypothetical protein